MKRTVTVKWLEVMQKQGKMEVFKETTLDPIVDNNVKQPVSNTISPDMAVAFVFKAASDDLPIKWEQIKSQIIGYDEIFEEVPEERVQFEFILASLGIDLLVLHNLFPKQQANELHDLLTLVGQMEEIGKNSATAVHDYYLVASDAVSKPENPMEYAASFLCHRLDLSADHTGPIALTGIMYGIGQFVGKWKWINENFTVAA